VIRFFTEHELTLGQKVPDKLFLPLATYVNTEVHVDADEGQSGSWTSLALAVGWRASMVALTDFDSPLTPTELGGGEAQQLASLAVAPESGAVTESAAVPESAAVTESEAVIENAAATESEVSLRV